jgi:hypothetical protein
MKTSELTGAALDWAVAQCEGFDNGDWLPDYSTDWAAGGTIIERERIAMFVEYPKDWCATDGNHRMAGKTPLIAAMRCYVTSKLGDEVDVPKELLTHV